MRLSSILAVILLAGCKSAGELAHTNGQVANVLSARVDSVFADIRDDSPGCAVGVYRNGEVVLAKGYGLANLEDGRRISPRTNFDLGSAAKPFTALATLRLAEKNRISLDDDVRHYVPELPDYGTVIRIRDLLQHTSGLRDYGAVDILAGRETLAAADFLALLSSQQQLNLVPGTRHEYSHSDFELLGLIIERIAKEPFGAHLDREVLRPLGMMNSRAFNPRDTRVRERAFGYVQSNDGFRVVFNNGEIVGGGNLYSSIEDLARWDRALAEGESGRRPLIARMLTRPTLPSGDTIPYAYGLRKQTYRGLPIVLRGGHTNGIRTEIRRFSSQGITVATLCNADHLNAYQRNERVADVYLGAVMQPLRTYHAPPAVAITVPELERYVGYYQSPDELDLSRIVIVGGKLVELFGDTSQTFTYRGDGVFTGDGITGDFRLVFSRDSNQTMRMQYRTGDEVLASWERIADSALWRPDSTALSGYAGTYFSAELNTVWTLDGRNGELVLRRPGRASGPLLPTRPDVFTRHFGVPYEPLVALFEFKRDSAGRIGYFTITTPPGEDVVRGLRFVRVSGR
jgi:CubicO group peptidase (beta-lactamase class C family)